MEHQVPTEWSPHRTPHAEGYLLFTNILKWDEWKVEGSWGFCCETSVRSAKMIWVLTANCTTEKRLRDGKCEWNNS